MHKHLTNILILTLLVATMLLGTSCMRHDMRCVDLMGNGRYCLQPTTVLTPFNVQQKVEASIKNHNEIIVTEIEVNAEGMQLIGLTPFGHQLVHVNYNNEKAIAVVSPDSRLDPALIIAMVQLALWPVDSVRKGLDEPLTLEEIVGHRRYLANNNLIVDVIYENTTTPANKLHISFPTVGLMLDIESLPEIERLP